MSPLSPIADVSIGLRPTYLSLVPCAEGGVTGANTPGSDGASVGSGSTLVDDCWRFAPLPFAQEAPSKVKYLPPCVHLQILPDTRISCLKDDAGRRYIMGAKFKQGTWGKLKFALPIDDSEKIYCIKETRLRQDNAAPRGPRKTTEVSKPEEVHKEWQMSRKFGGPFKALHHFAMGHRHYMLFDVAADSLLRFIGRVDPNDCAWVARTVALSVGETLRRMHQHSCLHLDVTSANILVSLSEPYFALADFGAATRLTGRHASNKFGERSSYCTPEVLDAADTFSVTPKIDMWGLGAVLLSLLGPAQQRYAPHLLFAATRHGGVDKKQTRHKLELFDQARLGHSHGAIGPIKAWLDDCKMKDAPLTQLVLASALVPLRQRKSAEQFVTDLMRLPPLPERSAAQKQRFHTLLQSTYADFLSKHGAAPLQRVRLHGHLMQQDTGDGPP